MRQAMSFEGVLGAVVVLGLVCLTSINCQPASVCTLEDNGRKVDDCVGGETDSGRQCSCEGDLREDGPAVDPVDTQRPTFRFVLIEDLTPTLAGDFPGADIDAVGLIKADETEVFATSVEADTDIECEGNLSCDPSSLLGPPDAVDARGCFGGGAPDPSRFTSLAGGLAIVGFAQSAAPSIENGDRIHIYEVGSTECQGNFDDDPYAISVSVSAELSGSFIEIGSGGNGENIIPVSGL